MGDEVSNSELRDTWEAAAPGWAKWERAFSAGLKGVTADLLDMAGVAAGARVLDIACGAGAQTLEAARRVGPDGAVVASDISAAMLEHVRRNAEAAGITNIETREGAAESVARMDSQFDAAICRLGLMLFPKAGASLSAVRRALKPGARFSALVFSTPANNPFMAQPMDILLRHAGKQPPGADRPGIFALGGQGALETRLSDSGFVEVDTKTVRAPLDLPSAAAALEMIQQAFGAYRAVVAELGEKERAGAWAEVEARLRQFETDAGFSCEFEFIIGSGARS